MDPNFTFADIELVEAGACPTCLSRVKLTHEGMISDHCFNDYICSGSGDKPERTFAIISDESDARTLALLLIDSPDMCVRVLADYVLHSSPQARLVSSIS